MRRYLARVVAVVVAAQILWGAAAVFEIGVRRIREGWQHHGDDPQAALVRIRGAAYADGVAAIRARIPPDGAYLLVDEGAAPAWGEMIWLRFDLAPRKAQYLGWLRDGRLVEEAEAGTHRSYAGLRRAALRNLAGAPPPPFVVVLTSAKDGRPVPHLEETAAFLAAHAR